jgi:hypothetical protein
MRRRPVRVENGHAGRLKVRDIANHLIEPAFEGDRGDLKIGAALGRSTWLNRAQQRAD